MTPLRAVPDTNVVVSVLVFHSGALSWMRGAWRSGSACPLASPQTDTEMTRIPGYPGFALNVEDQRDLLDDCLPW